jgi:hypothetical protein
LVGVEIKDVELLRKEDKENWEIGLLPDQYFYQALHYFVVLNNVKEVVVLAHLNYMKFDEEIYNDPSNTFWALSQ